ncbi:MAG: ATP-grasp domain-containing protein [Pseudomonadota bacterium]
MLRSDETLLVEPSLRGAAGKRIVAIGVPWSIHELAPAAHDARALGARLVLVDTPDTLASIDPAIGIEPLSVTRLALPEIVEALRERDADAVISLTEMTLGLAAEVREVLGLRGTSARTERSISDKAMTRRVLREKGLTRTQSWETPLADLPALVRMLPLPVVAKPLALTGSTGVQLIESENDVAALQRQYSVDEATRYGRDRLVVESFIPGEEVSAEAMVVDGKLTLLALTDKLNTGAPHFFEIGHVMPSRHSAVWSAQIAAYLQNVSDALGIVTSPVHAELKLSDEGPELVEIHSRFGGDNIVRLLGEAFGLRAFRLHFEALFRGEAVPPTHVARTCGIGFFTARIGADYRAQSFAFPHPEAVTEIDFDVRRKTKLEIYEGVQLTYRRLGHCLFVSDDYDAVAGNLSFMADRLCSIDGVRP